MKKKNLILNRETVRQLSSAELHDPRGGVDTNPNTTLPMQCTATSAGPGCSALICVDTAYCTSQWTARNCA